MTRPAAGAHSCEIAWGEGVTTTGVVDVGTCSGSHVYGAAGSGSREIAVSVFDAAMTRGSADVAITINRTAASCVRGDGQACTIAGAGLAGTVRFNLAARQVGTNRLGHLEMNDGKAWRFDARVVSEFSVAGSAATFSGEGLLDGRTGYRFEATVQDTAVSGLPDRLRVVVRDSAGAVARVVDSVVYAGRSSSTDRPDHQEPPGASGESCILEVLS